VNDPSPEIEQWRDLEESLWSASTRFDRVYMDALLAEEFVEFGRSGRRYDRTQILEIPAEEIDADLDRFAVKVVAADVALVTYRSVVRYPGGVQHAWRASLWAWDGERWRLHFHQGTAIGQPVN
jgi:ribonuclease HI